MKKEIAWMLLAGMAGVVGLGGSSDDAPSGQGRQEQEEACQLGVGAFINNCNRKGLGLWCRRCCQRRGSACADNATYEFDSCLR